MDILLLVVIASCGIATGVGFESRRWAVRIPSWLALFISLVLVRYDWGFAPITRPATFACAAFVGILGTRVWHRRRAAAAGRAEGEAVAGDVSGGERPGV